MAKGIRLRDADTEELYYPLTVSDLVVDHETGESVKHRLDTIFDSPTITNPTINGGEFNDGNINRPSIKDGNIGGCNISEATITESNIDSSELSNGNIHHSNIADSVISGDTYINEVVINDSIINNPTVEGGYIKDSILETVTLDSSTFDSGTIHESDINFSTLEECDLTNVRIKGTITDSVINNPTLKGGSISNVSSISISGGKPTQFLKADGSIDETTYIYRNGDGTIHISESECFKADTSKDNLNIAYTNSNGNGFAFEYDPGNLNIYGVDHLSVNSREVAFKDELESTVGEDNNQKYVQRNSRGLIQMNGNTDGFWYNAKNNKFDVRFFSVDEDNPDNLNQLHFMQNANDDGCLNIYATQQKLKFNYDEVALTKNYYTKKTIDEKLSNSIPTNVSQLRNDSGYQTKTDVDETIKKVVGNAPEALDTLEEIAEKLKGDDDSIKAINSILTDKANRSEIPTKVSQLTNDKNYLTSHQSLGNYYTKTESDGRFQPKGNYLTSHQSLSGYAKTTDIPTKTSQLTNDSGYLAVNTKDGVVEVGRYFDFHTTDYFGKDGKPTEDYTVRIDGGTSTDKRVFTFPTTGGTLATESFVKNNDITKSISYRLGDGVSATSGKARWIRIAKATDGASNALINISNGYWDENSDCVLLYVNKGYNVADANSFIQQLGGRGGTRIFTKARWVVKSHTDEAYLEVYYDCTSGRNTLFINATNVCRLEFYTTPTDGEIPSGYRVVSEIDLTKGIVSDSFKKIGGTSSQFLKADGSVDSNTYAKETDGTLIDPIIKETSKSPNSIYFDNGDIHIEDPQINNGLIKSATIDGAYVEGAIIKKSTLDNTTINYSNIFEGELAMDEGYSIPISDICYFFRDEKEDLIKKNGTKDQFLKADGSVDDTQYIPIKVMPYNANGYYEIVLSYGNITLMGFGFNVIINKNLTIVKVATIGYSSATKIYYSDSRVFIKASSASITDSIKISGFKQGAKLSVPTVNYITELPTNAKEIDLSKTVIGVQV